MEQTTTRMAGCLRKSLRTISGFGLALSVSYQAAADMHADGDKQVLTGAIAGYSAGGMLSVLGEGLTAMARAEYPGSSLTYEPGNPAGGLVSMVAGKRPFSMQSPLELAAAMSGKPPFRRVYNSDDFSVVGQIVDGMAVQLVMRGEFLREHGITGFQGVADQQLPLRLSTSSRGNLIGQLLTKRILAYYGLNFKQVIARGGEVVYLPSRTSAEMLRNRKLDFMLLTAYTPSSRLIEMATATDIRLLSMPPGLRRELADEFGLRSATIPADSYSFLDADLPTLTIGFYLTAGNNTSNSDSYKMAKTLYQQFETLRGLHSAFMKFQPDMLIETGGLPLHPGAAAYYREVGLLPQD